MSAVVDDSFDHQTPNAELRWRAVPYLEAGGLENKRQWIYSASQVVGLVLGLS